jgi:hypothetical protein
MWIRLLRSLPVIAALAIPAARAASAQTACDCCAKKPRIDEGIYSSFTGQVVIATKTEDNLDVPIAPFPAQVVMIWDLTYQSAAPLNQWWDATNPTGFPPTHPYSHPDWTVYKLGNVFGLTLDDSGNIYVAATSIMGSGARGSLGAGVGNAQRGNIYKLQNGSGAPVQFALLPQGPLGEGLGNLDYDCGHRSLYASDFFDGLVYRIDATGIAQPNAWDHGLNLPTAIGPTGLPLGRGAILGFDGSSSYAALGRRVWAVRVHNNRLFYSVVNQYWDREAPLSGQGLQLAHQQGSSPTEIWSVALDATGDPYAPARLEITLPPFSTAFPYTNPVSDITFGPLGTMLVAERTLTSNNSSYAHSSRVLEYAWNGTTWTLPNPTAYQVGIFAFPAGNPPADSAGGVAFDFGTGGHIWATGDALHLNNPDIYGLQGFPAGGGDVTTSILIDLNDDVSSSNKTQIGDVRVPCPDCASAVVVPVITGPQSMCVSPLHYSVAPQPGVTYTWTVTGGTPTTGTGTAIDVIWGGTTTVGTIKVTATGPGGCGAVTSTLRVVPCNINCPLCNDVITNVVVPTPTAGFGGLETVTPTVTSNMSGVTSVTVTLLNASVAYNTAVCGSPGPLAGYLPQALASSAGGFNPPFLPVPNGNQAIWQAGSPVNLAAGATTPFQLQLPGAPPFAAPLFTPPRCRATFSFCLRVSLATADCRDCDVITCYGPFPYAPSAVGGEGSPGVSESLAPFSLPGVLTFAVPTGSYLEHLMDFLQGQGGMALPRRFVMDHLSFEPGKAAVTEDSLPTLHQLATILKAYSTLQVRLEGHTDNVGDAEANRLLALERAQAVKTLLERAGAPPDRVEVGGKGAARPPAPNQTEQGGTTSRGVDLVVLHK